MPSLCEYLESLGSSYLIGCAGSPLGLPDVSIAELQPEGVVAHERDPVPVSLTLVEPADLGGYKSIVFE